MTFEQSVSNRLHRSGAIDFNVMFDIRQAQMHEKPQAQNNKRCYASSATGPDQLSVCEGEPLYNSHSKRSKFGGGCPTTRKPLQLLSSLNGMTLEAGTKQDQDMYEEEFDIQFPTVNDAVDRVSKRFHHMRTLFFQQVRPNGVSVTKWDYGAAGRQGELFVATMGGANTIYVDDDVYAGDTIIVDLPLGLDCEMQGLFAFDDDTFTYAAAGHNYGFVECQSKRGIPKCKKTLVVRSLPLPPKGLSPHLRDVFEKGFYARRQVLGQCTKGAKKGERCDLILGANAVGIDRPL